MLIHSRCFSKPVGKAREVAIDEAPLPPPPKKTNKEKPKLRTQNTQPLSYLPHKRLFLPKLKIRNNNYIDRENKRTLPYSNDIQLF